MSSKLSFNPEGVMYEVLQKMVVLKIIPHFLHAEKNSELDRDGVDFLVYCWSGLSLPLQISGYSARRLRKKKKMLMQNGGAGRYVKIDKIERHLKKHSHVKFVFIITRNSQRFIFKKLRRLVQKIDKTVQELYFSKSTCYTTIVK